MDFLWMLRKFGVQKHVFWCTAFYAHGASEWKQTPFSSLLADLEQCSKYGGKLDCFSLLLLFTARKMKIPFQFNCLISSTSLHWPKYQSALLTVSSSSSPINISNFPQLTMKIMICSEIRNRKMCILLPSLTSKPLVLILSFNPSIQYKTNMQTN